MKPTKSTEHHRRAPAQEYLPSVQRFLSATVPHSGRQVYDHRQAAVGASVLPRSLARSLLYRRDLVDGTWAPTAPSARRSQVPSAVSRTQTCKSMRAAASPVFLCLRTATAEGIGTALAGHELAKMIPRATRLSRKHHVRRRSTGRQERKDGNHSRAGYFTFRGSP